MKLRVLLPFLVAWAGCAASKPVPRPEGPTTLAERYVTLLAAGDFTAATALFSGEMRSGLPADKLRETWESIVTEHGAFKRQVGSLLEKVQKYDVVLVRAEFERSELTLKVVINGNREIDGFFYLPGPPVSKDAVPAATKFVAQLASGEWGSASAMTSEKMKAGLPPEKLKELWASLVAQNGAFKKQLGVKTESSSGFEIVLVGCEFEKGSLILKVVLRRDDRKVSGLWIQPHYRSSELVKKDSFDERDVVVGADPWKLPGTLTVPTGAGPFPALVLVHGSGPNDRDETIGPNKPFRDLAEGLGSRGIAVLRYDKRTRVHGGKIDAIKGFTVKDEAIDDAVAAVSLLKGIERIASTRIFVLGHSLGGTLVPRIVQAEPSLAGAVILAGSTRRIEDVLAEQLNYLFNLDGKVTPEEQAGLEQLERDTEVLRDPKLDRDRPGNIQGAPASYWVDLRDYDAPATAKSLKQPLLVLQGERDYQVTMVDFASWKAALASRKDVVLKTYPKLNHLFTEGEGPKSTPAEYDDPKHIPEAVLDDIAGWIAKH